jgi:hypothetical protein
VWLVLQVLKPQLLELALLRQVQQAEQLLLEQPEQVLHLHFGQHPFDALVFRFEQEIQLQFCRWKEQVPLRTSAQAEA